MLRRLEKKQTSQGKFSVGRSKQCFGSQLCLKFLLLFWNTPKEILKKSHKKRWFYSLRQKKMQLPTIAFFPNLSSLWMIQQHQTFIEDSIMIYFTICRSLSCSQPASLFAPSRSVTLLKNIRWNHYHEKLKIMWNEFAKIKNNIIVIYLFVFHVLLVFLFV